ncbi:phage tail protein [Brevibacillus centrosporus]|uniref:phage tail protein n=2 Tax=Brevibacillus centrosporus TaxID=54910 RepID=UPI000F09D218|nr:phage tail protein [Brevibacillus centrosporus]MEC2128128.1 phage tail protein [Brevibacillus centrosporus]RNB63816.1 phage tail protein [Brevibacillus centrosporus]
MSSLGNLGPVVFVATQETLRTFQEFTRSSASRYADHEILGKKPKSQWIGPGLDTISFSMAFDALYGLNPRKELNQLVELERSGKALPLAIGGVGIGVYMWSITALEQKWDVIDNQGYVWKATANITLKEYVK